MASRALVVLFLSALVGVGSCVPFVRGGEPQVAAPAAVEAHRPRLLPGVGSHRHPIATKSPEAQRFFDQGLVLTYGFNHFGAIDAFREAARLDPECAMCFWGIAYAYGPNINAPMGPEGATGAWAALEEARSRLQYAAPLEREYIEALTARYAPDPAAREPRGPRRRLRRGDARAPPAPSRGSRRGHALRRGGDGPPPLGLLDRRRRAARAAPSRPRATLEAVLERDPWHPGANHFLIHMFEEFEPERAEAAADRLVSIAPDGRAPGAHARPHLLARGPLPGRLAGERPRAGLGRGLPHLVSPDPVLRGALLQPQRSTSCGPRPPPRAQSDVAITSARQLAGGVPVRPAEELPAARGLPHRAGAHPRALRALRRGARRARSPRRSCATRRPSGTTPEASRMRASAARREAEAEPAAFEAIASDPAWEQTSGSRARLARALRGGAATTSPASSPPPRHDSAGAVAELEAAVAAQDRSTTPSRRPSTSRRARPSAPCCSTPAGPPTPRPSTARTSRSIRRTAGRSSASRQALRAQKKTRGGALGGAGLRQRLGTRRREAQRVAVLSRPRNAKRPETSRASGRLGW